MDSEKLAAVQKALDRTKIKLMGTPDTTFFTSVCFSLRHVISDEVLTAATDGETLWINPDFFLSLHPDERMFVLLHEVLHVCYLHMLRRGERDPYKWNCAADYAINLYLRDRHFVLPSSALLDEQYSGLSAEQIYERLPADFSGGGWEDLVYPGSGGTNGNGQDHPDIQAREQQILDTLIRASIQAQMANDKPGSIPGDIELWLSQLTNPILPWDRLFRKYMNEFSRNDYSWRKPNRRFFPDYHLPSLYSESLIDIAIAVDASGSVSDEEFHQFASEVAYQLRRFKPNKVTLITFDVAIRQINELRSVSDLMQIQFTGRGGTLIKPVLEWADENKPQLLLIFTDGYFHPVTANPKYKLLWLIHNNKGFECPYGKIIHYTIKR